MLDAARFQIATSVNTILVQTYWNIGKYIVLGAERDRLTVQYALEGINNQLFVSRYQLYLLDRDALSREVYRIIEAHSKEDGKSGA